VMPLDETLQIQAIMEKVIKDWGVSYPTDRD
jgi:hypothetical protein